MDTPIESLTAREITIVDDEGQPRIRAHVTNGVAEVVVQMGDDPSSHALVYAGVLEPGGTQGLGVELCAGGDSLGRMSAVREEREWKLSR